MSNLSHELHRGRDQERDRRYFNNHVNDEGHYHHHPYGCPLVALDPPDGTTAFKHRRSNERARSQSIRRLESESHDSRHSHSLSPTRAASHLGVPIPGKRSKSERSAEKAISAAAAAAFRVRNDPGHWVGGKGFTVASAAVAAATVDALLDTDPHKHPLQHIAVAMVQGVVMDRITDGGPH